MDPLLGLKENVIIGKLVPAGTGMSRYRNISVSVVEAQETAEEEPELSGTDLPYREEAMEKETVVGVQIKY